MFVACDIESREEGGYQKAITLSYGREDGSSGTYIFGDGPEAVWAGLHWLIDELCRPWIDAEGRQWRQVPIGFHLNHDAAVYGVAFEEADMMIIRKSVQRYGVMTPLCNTLHKPGEIPCDKTHRFDQKALQDIITDGGEGDLISWHEPSKLGLAFTPKRRIYIEHRPEGDRMEGRRVLDIHDVGTAFVGGLITVIQNWCPKLDQQQEEIIKAGKAVRSTGFPGWSPAMQGEYSEAECIALTRCCRLLIDMVKLECHVVVRPSRLFGAGSIANATLRHYGAPKRDDSDLGTEAYAFMTYFGGMIETPVVGRIRATINEVDINSAYPDKLRHVPCTRLGCGRWKSGSKIPDSALLGHVQVSWDTTGDPTSTPPFMVRDTEGSVYQPLTGQVLASLAEYRVAAPRFKNKIILHKAFWWEAHCTCDNPYPFEFLEKLYDRRLAIKAEMGKHPKGSDEWYSFKVREEAVKLVLNSMYGKMAQQRPDYGTYTNLHIASYITGATRAQLRTETWARETQNGTVIYQHTDSVKSLGGTPTNGGKILGAWGIEPDLTDYFIIQPGFAVPIVNSGKGSTRGVKRDDVYDALPEWLDTTDLTQPPETWPSLNVATNRMISRRQAVARGKPALAGTFEPGSMGITLRSHKRLTEAARPLPEAPEAWAVPPIPKVQNPATYADRLITAVQWQLAKRDSEEGDII